MAHIRGIQDDAGDLVDLIWFCSDDCNRYFEPGNVDVGLEPYAGWNGCHENEFDEICAECQVVIEGYEQRDRATVKTTVKDGIATPL